MTKTDRTCDVIYKSRTTTQSSKNGRKLPVVWMDMPIDGHGGLYNTLYSVAERLNPNFKIVEYAGKYRSLEEISKEDFPDFIIAENSELLNYLQSNESYKKPMFLIGKSDWYIIEEYRSNGSHKEYGEPNCIGVPHLVTSEKIEAGKKEWETQFSGLSEPKIAVLLGGKAGENFDFTAEKARKMAKECASKAKELGGSLIITTSKRTGKEVTEAFMDEIHKFGVQNYLHEWTDDPNKSNPYFGMLVLADAIIVTGDSKSMCCDANTSKKPVYIYDFDGALRESDKDLHQQLYARNLAKPFSEFLEHGIVPWKYEPLDTAGDIAKEALKLWREQQKKQSSPTPY